METTEAKGPGVWLSWSLLVMVMVWGFVLFGQESTAVWNEPVQAWKGPCCSWWRVDCGGTGGKPGHLSVKLNAAQMLGVIPFIQEQPQEQPLLSLASWGSLLRECAASWDALVQSSATALHLRKAAIDRCLLCPQTSLVSLLCLLTDMPY